MSLTSLSVSVSVYMYNPVVQSSGRNILISKERLLNIKLAIYKYNSHNSTTITALDQLVTPGASDTACAVDTTTTSSTYRQMTGWCGPYLKITFAQDSESFKMDGWGTNLEYTVNYIRSCGANRTCGDGDDIYEQL